MKSLAARFRNIDAAHRATYVGPQLAGLAASAATSPERLANQILMHVTTWGETGQNGERWKKWSVLARELEAQLGAPPLAVFGVAARYGLDLDLEKDRLTVPDLKAFSVQLRADLGR
jgi:hypothetical protein